MIAARKKKIDFCFVPGFLVAPCVFWLLVLASVSVTSMANASSLAVVQSKKQ